MFCRSADIYAQSGCGYTDDNTTTTLGGDGSGTLGGIGNPSLGALYDDTNFSGCITSFHNSLLASYANTTGNPQNAVAQSSAAVLGGYNNTAGSTDSIVVGAPRTWRRAATAGSSAAGTTHQAASAAPSTGATARQPTPLPPR